MREYSQPVDEHLADLDGVVPRYLTWISAQNRSTGAPEATGFWSGATEREFTIGGDARDYFGAGALLDVAPIRAGIGLDVRIHQLTLSGMPQEVLDTVHKYDARLAPVEVHRALFFPETRNLIAEPHRVLKGTVEGLEVPTPAEGESANITVRVASAARSLTRALTLKKSDAAQRAIDVSDRGREYAAISGAVGVFWGTLSQRGAPPPTAGTAPDFGTDGR